MIRFRLAGLLLVALVLFGIAPVFGQNPALNTPLPGKNAAEAEIERNALSTLNTLSGILQAQQDLLTKIQQQEEFLKAAESDDEKTRIRSEIGDLQKRVIAAEKNFQSIATGIESEIFDQTSKTEFNWQTELQEIVGPIIEELKNLTARPREIERLRQDITTYTRQQTAIQSALDNILILKQYTTDSKIEQALSATENLWVDREKDVANALEIAHHQLDEKLRAEKPLGDSIQELFRNFFSSRGRNVLFAILAFLSVLVLLRYLYPHFVKISPFHGGRKRTFYGRLIDVLYGLTTIVGATLALIVVLYVTADWVLLGLVMILLIGLLWAARQGLPTVWEQVKLLLNLSTVRENERVLYNGLPWKVASLNLYTRFHNPALKGGLIRLPLRDLVSLQSRPFHKDEPWFPTQEGDWVLLDDGTFGTVILQTPEIVQLRLLGGSLKTYPTAAFVGQNPTDLSHDFRVSVTFGVDYKHQAISTQDVPAGLKACLQADLGRAGYTNHVKNVVVEFQEAAASSLDMAILVDFSGDIAQDYPKLQRLIQRIAVDACNEHGWEIPFTQITVHQARA